MQTQDCLQKIKMPSTSREKQDAKKSSTEHLQTTSLARKTGWCSTPPLLLICSSFSRENCHPLLICSSLSTAQKNANNLRACFLFIPSFFPYRTVEFPYSRDPKKLPSHQSCKFQESHCLKSQLPGGEKKTPQVAHEA